MRIILQLGKEKSSWSPTNTFEEVSILHCFVFFLQWLIKHTLLSIGLILCVLGVNSWASLVAQQKRICLPMQERCGFDPWVGKIPWRREWKPTPIFLPGESHGQRSLVGLQSMVSQSIWHDWVSTSHQGNLVKGHKLPATKMSKCWGSSLQQSDDS